MMGSASLYKGPQRIPCPLSAVWAQRGRQSATRKRTLAGSRPCWRPSLTLTASRTRRNNVLLLLSHPVCGVLSRWPEWTEPPWPGSKTSWRSPMDDPQPAVMRGPIAPAAVEAALPRWGHAIPGACRLRVPPLPPRLARRPAEPSFHLFPL